MLDQIRAYVEKRERLVVGLHSGTSADGVAAVVARVTGVDGSAAITPISGQNFDYPDDLRAAVLQLSEGGMATLSHVSQIDMAVGRFIATCAREIVEAAGLSLADCDAVVSSGQVASQVIEQAPEARAALGQHAITCMLDLGEGAVIAEETNVLTVSSLRRRDNAAGGSGAPLVPFGDWVMFRSAEEGVAVWNIGGIANPTVLPAGCSLHEIMAFDSGPGNMIIDAIVRAKTDGRHSYDAGGEIAASGQVDGDLLQQLMRSSFVAERPPKFAARQNFGHEYTAKLLRTAEERNLGFEDLVATATAFTAHSMRFAHDTFIAKDFAIGRMVLAGGGVLNDTLMRIVRDLFDDLDVATSDSLGIPADLREALCMALIGNQTLHGRPANVPAATGASRYVPMGHVDAPMTR